MPFGRRWLCCLAAVAAVGAATGAAGQGGEPAQEPSLEYRPPRPVLPEPKMPKPAPPAMIFSNSLGGFGIGAGYFDRPVDVAFDREGNVYVLDSGNSRVQKIDRFGRALLSWGSLGSRTGEFRDPAAIAFDTAGKVIYVADSGNNRIQKFDPQGKFLGSWGSLGTTSSNFKNPRDIAFDGEGNVLVVDSGNNRVQKFNPSGGFISEFGERFSTLGGVFTDLVSIAWTDEGFGMIYLLSGGCLVQQFEKEKFLVRSWSAVAPDSGLCVPARIRADNNPNERYLYVVDAGNGLVMRFHGEGVFFTAFRKADRPFLKPQGLNFNSRREFVVADTGNNIVQLFTLR